MIITPQLMQKCNVVFRSLLRTRGCTWAMNEAFILLSEGQGVTSDENRCVISVYRHEMAHFIHVWEAHLIDVAFSRPWTDLQRRLTAAASLEDIRDCVADYINSVYDL